MGSLRQFSTKRVVGLALADWVGTLALLYLAWRLGGGPAQPGNWPPVLQPGAQVGALAGHPAWPTPFISVLAAVLWPFTMLAFSVYDGRRNATLRAELGRVLEAIGVSTIALAGAAASAGAIAAGAQELRDGYAAIRSPGVAVAAVRGPGRFQHVGDGVNVDVRGAGHDVGV